MNALPLKTRREPSEIIDDLIADHGFVRVILALIGRIVRRARTPAGLVGKQLIDTPRIDLLNDHIRRDLGLPPEGRPHAHIDLSLWAHRDLF